MTDYINIMNNDIIEIVSSISELNLLRKAGNKNTIVALPLELEIGKININNPFDRSNLTDYYNDSYNYDFTSIYTKLKELTKETNKVRIWSSHLNTNDYCLLLLMCSCFKNVNIGAIYSEELNWNFTTLSAISVEDIPKLETKEHILQNFEKDDYVNEWNNILKDNKELRYVIHSRVKSVDINNFDSFIINRLTSMGKVYIYKFIASLMVDSFIPLVSYSDSVWLYLINNLEKKCVIKSCIIDDKKYIEVV